MTLLQKIKRIAKVIIALLLVAVIGITAWAMWTVYDNSKDEKPSRTQVAQILKSNNMLATTEVTVSKIVFWDEDEQDISWTDTRAKLKNIFGTQKFLFPVTGTLTYGFDLKNFSSSDIGINDDSVLIINLPAPTLLMQHFPENINTDELITTSTGLRGSIGTKKLLKAKTDCEKYIVESSDSIMQLMMPEITNNATTVFQNLVKGTGWKAEIVIDDAQ